MTDETQTDTPTEPDAGESAPPPLPEASFLMLAYLLSSQALAHLGELPDGSGMEKNLPQAKFTIDLLEILQAKTEGNLTEEEQQFLKRLLFDLRNKFVFASKSV
jgi:Domain of unknown function (DUF1844)